jgi:hypothetical protein
MGKKSPQAVATEPVTPTLADVIWLDSDGVVHIRNSERGTHDKCDQQWWWSWRDGLRPKETPKPLWFGSAIHEALAHYYAPGYKRRKDFVDKFREYADMEAEYIRTAVGGLDEDEYVDARTLGETMLTGYVDEYNGDKDWDVIATEQTFEVKIPWMLYKRNPRYTPEFIATILNGHEFNTDYFILNGTFDGVYRHRKTKRVRLMEHKTAASISLTHLPMDNQAGTYWLVAQTVGRSQGWLGPKENITGITYNFLRKGMPDERPKDAHGYSLNKPGKQAFINVLNPHIEWETTRTGTVKYPTIEVMQKMCDERGLVVLGERSKSQPPPLYLRHEVRRGAAQRATQLERLTDEVTVMTSKVTGLMPITKSSGRDTCPMCPFKDMCELHEARADWQDYRDALFRVEDLYAVHRKSA